MHTQTGIHTHVAGGLRGASTQRVDLVSILHSMSSSMVQPMHSSLQSAASDRGADDVDAAPRYPRRGQSAPNSPSSASPSRAGRKRRPDERPNGGRRRLEDEPRFNTAVPASSARRLQPVAARPPRGRKHVYIPAPTHLQVDSVDDPAIPDYPPPSFQEAISSSPYPPTFPLPTTGTPSEPQPVRTPILPPSPLPQSDHVDSPEEVPSPILSIFSDSPESGSDTDSIEVLTLDPPERWEADRQMGVPLDERVVRDFERHQLAESTTALSLPIVTRSVPSSSPSPPETPTSHMRRCSHCGSARPSACDDDTHSALETDEDRDEVKEPVKFVKRRFFGMKIIKMNDETSSSAPSSPTSPSSVSRMPSAWASNLTLSFSGALTSHKLSPISLSPRKKENTGIRKLFSSKGKERSPSPPDLIGEPLESWEVVDSRTQDTRQSMIQMPDIHNNLPRATLRVTPPVSNPVHQAPVSPPSSPFLERPVRRLQSPTSPQTLSSSIPPSPHVQYRYQLPSEAPSPRNALSPAVPYDRRFLQQSHMNPPPEKSRRF